MSLIDIHFTTDRFNLSVVDPTFINDCCFGEDLSRWLVTALCQRGIEAAVICMEDFGWANEASYNGHTYLLCVAGASDEDSEHPNRGEWHIMLERKRTWLEVLQGKAKITPDDPVVQQVLALLQAEGFAELAVEGPHGS